MKKVLFIVSLLLSGVFVLAQEKIELKTKFGKISDEEIQMKQYDKDPDAAAVVLFDKGFASLGNYDGFERHTRIKIFKKEGYDKANFRILFSRKGQQYVSNVKASCYNMENGKLVETKATSDNMGEESLNKYTDVKKITIPAVREGSIIELHYELSNYGVPDWIFQDDIPTIWSEYVVEAPQYLVFTKISRGSVPYAVNTQTQRGETRTGTNFSYNVNIFRWVQKNIPALKPEKYIFSAEDYRSKIAFYLQELSFPGVVNKMYITDWEKTSEELWKDEDFGDIINSKSSMSEELKNIVNDKMTAIEKVQAIYEYLGKNFETRKGRIFYATESVRDMKKTRKVSTAELNLLLLNMLHTAGIKATPVILRSREDGRLFTNLAVVRRFNQVIAQVLLEKDTFLVDAAGYPRPLKLLPVNDLSGYAITLPSKNTFDIITPKSKLNNRSFFQATLTLDNAGALNGTVNASFNGYDAYQNRSLLKEVGNEKFVGTLLKGLLLDGKLVEPNIENPETFNEMLLKVAAKVTTNTYVNKTDDKIYVSPMLCFGKEENPFKAETRTSEIDFSYLHDDFYQLALTLPDGYKVEELPKSTRLQLPNNGLRFEYLVAQTGNQVTINTKFNIKEIMFAPEEYASLKQFYAQMLSKMGEQIVLTKM
jgi:Domain of Unknown Function with PDB structure (DUF3857)